MEVIAHETAAAQQKLTHGFRLLVTQLPMPNFNPVEKGPIIVIALFKIDRLFDATAAYTGQTPYSFHEMTIAPRVVGRPARPPMPPVAGVPPETPAVKS